MEREFKKVEEFQIPYDNRQIWVDKYKNGTEFVHRVSTPGGLELRMWREPGGWKGFPEMQAVPALGKLIDKHDCTLLMKEVHADLLAMLDSLREPLFVQNGEKMDDLIIRLRGLMMEAAQFEPYRQWVESILGSEGDEAEPLEQLKTDISGFAKLIEQTEQLEDVY